MKSKRPPKPIHRLGAVTLGLTGCVWSLTAAPFLYAPGDLVLTFRQAGNAADYAVNIGKVTALTAVPSGTSITVTNLSATQLRSAFSTLNGLKWSAAAANRPPALPDFPLQTLWVTAPRTNPDIQSDPWRRKGQALQGNTASQVDGLGVNAALSSSLLPSGPDNTATGVIVPTDAPFAIGPVLGNEGDYAGSFQGSVENTTADDFEGAPSRSSRSDLYEVTPGTRAAGTLDTAARHLGYFELKPDGSLTFANPAAQPSRPAITTVTRQGNLTTIPFASVAGVNYRLRYTDAAGLGLPTSSWTAGNSITGNGSVVSLEDSATDSGRFYVVEALP